MQPQGDAQSVMEQRIQDMVSFWVGATVPPKEFLAQRLSQAEESKLQLELHVQRLQLRLVELDERLAKSKEEACMSATALRRHVAENERLAGCTRQAVERCGWLEEECSLYLQDREVFMAAADEAEERSSRAQERAVQAESTAAHLLSELASAKEHTQEEYMQWEEEIGKLKSKVQHLEKQNLYLQKELVAAATEAISKDLDIKFQHIEPHVAPQSPTLEKYVTTSVKFKGKQDSFERQLMEEVQRLWHEVALYKCNLAKAEIQIQILTDDNKDLKLALRNCKQHASSTSTYNKSPLPKKIKSSLDFSKGGDHMMLRQPLVPLRSNLLELR